MAKLITLKELGNRDIFFRNFRGLAKGKIPEGNRNFCVYIPENLVERMIDDGWTVQEDTYNLPEGEDPRHFIRVKARFDKFPPTCGLICNGKKVRLTEETIGRLDNDTILWADVQINGSYKKDGSGITAYLSKMVVEVEPDFFEEKFGSFDDYGDALDDETPFA